MKISHAFYLLLSFTLSVSISVAQNTNSSSPNGNVRLSFGLSALGEPYYKVYFKETVVLENSRLGLSLKGGDLRENFELLSTEIKNTDQTWKPVWGEEASIRNHYQELSAHLQEKNGLKRKMDIIFRVFDDGVGFRYEFPYQKDKLHHFVVTEENSEFALTDDHKAFWIPGDYDTNEYRYNSTKLSEINAYIGGSINEIYSKTLYAPNAAQTPLTMKTASGLYLNIFEAALDNYPAMQVLVDKKTFKLTSKLVPDPQGNMAYMIAPCHSPWRTIMIAENATGLLASRMILNLNEPSKIQDPSWIKPCKYVGVWWEMHVGKGTWDYAGTQDASSNKTIEPSGKHSANNENVKKYIDFAAKNGFTGVLVEGWNTGWEDWFGKGKEEVFDFVTPYPDFNVAELTKYAESKGVKIIMHHETSASVTNYERHMDEAYAFMKNYGYNMVKTGYVGFIIPRGEHHDGQWMVNHYNRVADKTAKNKIMLVAHEPVRPTGQHRTYPNWMACEAARGNEFNAWSEGNLPEHETILPFTRLLGGPMDYTPGIFRIKVNQFDPTKKEQVHTTLAKQLALYVTLYSPFQMAADLPQNYEQKPDAFQFIKDVAVDWDETRYLNAEIGDYLTVARKAKGKKDWFIGSVSDEQSREMDIKLDFLDADKSYQAIIYKDAANADWEKNPEAYQIDEIKVTKNSTLHLKLAPGGGCAIHCKAL
ncbi:MAG: glycoside hydrolase family 97 protein [Saprospiraceae bacterium]